MTSIVMEKQYRIPTIDEFVQGFTFEVLEYKKGTKLGSIGIIDMHNIASYKGRDIIAEEDYWKEVTVFWKREPEVVTKTFPDGRTWSWMEYPEMDWMPWIQEEYIEELINDKKVRVKIN